MSTVRAIPVESVPASVTRPPHLAPVPDPVPPAADTEPLGRLPGDWVSLNDVPVAAGDTIDRVVLGPNGVFAVHIDTDPRPAAVRPGRGLIRAGARDPEPVKRALRNTAALRTVLSALPGDVFPYPVLVTAAPGEAGDRLGRLLVVRPGRLPEAVWRHPSRPLTRSQRMEIRRALLET